MKSKKPIGLSKKDVVWQKKIEKKVKSEKLSVDHTKGKERFENTIKQIVKKDLNS